ncbi:hypothetical protein CNECB9_560002 [Cupriavidus necator]|uniref:Uncharacterized protein n=1 Tax=Cupriavidus necator TaxID=106590 RepID=A0A1K0IQQ7_CUPNE|nr:hypothetical protein CNECB9_560002 [Cupriavidus necator]
MFLSIQQHFHRPGLVLAPQSVNRGGARPVEESPLWKAPFKVFIRLVAWWKPYVDLYIQVLFNA